MADQTIDDDRVEQEVNSETHMRTHGVGNQDDFDGLVWYDETYRRAYAGEL